MTSVVWIQGFGSGCPWVFLGVGWVLFGYFVGLVGSFLGLGGGGMVSVFNYFPGSFGGFLFFWLTGDKIACPTCRVVAGDALLDQAFQAVQGFVVLAIKADFVAAEALLAAGWVLEGEHCHHCLGRRVGDAAAFGLLTLFIVEADGFEGPVAEESPAIDGEVVDQVEFPLVLGQEFPDVGVFEGQETVGGFAEEEDGLGEEAVFDGIAGGDALASGGVGAVGFATVDSARFLLFFGWWFSHTVLV